MSSKNEFEKLISGEELSPEYSRKVRVSAYDLLHSKRKSFKWLLLALGSSMASVFAWKLIRIENVTELKSLEFDENLNASIKGIQEGIKNPSKMTKKQERETRALFAHEFEMLQKLEIMEHFELFSKWEELKRWTG